MADLPYGMNALEVTIVSSGANHLFDTTPGSIVGTVYATGSINTLASSFLTSGNVYLQSGTTTAYLNSGNVYIQSGGAIGVYAQSGNVYVASGIVTTVSSVTNVVNSYLTSGTTNITNLGSPSFKHGDIVASGTYTEVWTLANAGSKLEIHGWDVSTSVAMFIRMLLSGTTPVQVADYWLPASGTVCKTFVQPITPGNAGIDFGVGTSAAGSVHVTLYGKEIT